MANITGTRRGRQRKVVPDVKADGQGATQPAINSGNGQAGASGENGAAKDSGPGKVVGWAGLVEAVNAESGLVSTAWHPNPEAELIGTNASDVRVLQGEVAYQLSTGEIIKL